MQILTLKTEESFLSSEVPEGKLLVWPEQAGDGVILRYKTSSGQVGTLGGGSGALFTGSLLNAALMRGHGGSGGPGEGLAMEPAVITAQESIVFDQSILKG